MGATPAQGLLLTVQGSPLAVFGEPYAMGIKLRSDTCKSRTLKACSYFSSPPTVLIFNVATKMVRWSLCPVSVFSTYERALYELILDQEIPTELEIEVTHSVEN